MKKINFYTKTLAAAVALVLLVAASLFAQESAGDRQNEESAIILDGGTGADLAGPDAENSPGSVWILVRIVLVLVAVCAGIYGIVYLLKKSSNVSAASDPYIRVVAQLPLAPGKTVQVLSVGSQAFLVGVSDSGIQQIAEITDKELIDAMNLEASRKSDEPVPAFSSLLSRFLPRTARTADNQQKNVSDSADSVHNSAEETADFIRRQRERLSSGRNSENTGREQ